MAKRKLSKNQSRRLSHHHAESIKRAKSRNTDTQPTFDDSNLGPEEEGTVIANYGTQVDVEECKNKSVVRCHIRANISSLVAGDQVIFRNGDDSGVIVSIIPRTTELFRPDSYGNMKLVAANVDQLIITIAPKPEPFTNLIDRYLVVAESNGIQPILIINKSDLMIEFDRDELLRISALYQKLGYTVLQVSAKQPKGITELESLLVNKTSIFVGQSGVGKSSLVNALAPDLNVKVGDLSHAATKGKHTTTHSQLFHFVKGGAFIDSPGIREFGLWHIEKENVINGFIELKDAADHCRFRNCSHNKEPGCAIKSAVKDGKITQERFSNYLQITASVDDVEIKEKNNK